MAHQLNQPVLPAAEEQFPVFIIAAEVAGFVENLRILIVQRVLNIAFHSHFRIAEVPQGHADAGYADLAGFSRFRGRAVLIQQDDAVIPVGSADGQHRVRIRLFPDHIVCAGGSRLRRAVLVDEFRLRQVRLPLRQHSSG